MGTIQAICVSKKKGTTKHAVDCATLKMDWGIEGDAHAGEWHRQVSLLPGESIDQVKKVIPSLTEGAFGENLITRGIELAELKIGDRIRVGDAELEITQIGKECHHGCAIKQQTGDCIMPRQGLFARVTRAGEIVPGMPVTRV